MAEKSLEERIDRLLLSMERAGFNEYMEYLADRRKLIFRAFLSGIARGFGLAIGFTVLGAAVIALLQRLILDSMPNISAFLADMIRIIQAKI